MFEQLGHFCTIVRKIRPTSSTVHIEDQHGKVWKSGLRTSAQDVDLLLQQLDVDCSSVAVVLNQVCLQRIHVGWCTGQVNTLPILGVWFLLFILFFYKCLCVVLSLLLVLFLMLIISFFFLLERFCVFLTNRTKRMWMSIYEEVVRVTGIVKPCCFMADVSVHNPQNCLLSASKKLLIWSECPKQILWTLKKDKNGRHDQCFCFQN